MLEISSPNNDHSNIKTRSQRNGMKVIFTKVNPSEEIKWEELSLYKKTTTTHELLRKGKQNDFNYQWTTKLPPKNVYPHWEAKRQTTKKPTKPKPQKAASSSPWLIFLLPILARFCSLNIHFSSRKTKPHKHCCSYCFFLFILFLPNAIPLRVEADKSLLEELGFPTCEASTQPAQALGRAFHHR